MTYFELLVILVLSTLLVTGLQFSFLGHKSFRGRNANRAEADEKRIQKC